MFDDVTVCAYLTIDVVVHELAYTVTAAWYHSCLPAKWGRCQ